MSLIKWWNNMDRFYDHHCPNCGDWCDCDIMDEETGLDNIYFCKCDCPRIEIENAEHAENISVNS